MDPEFQRAMVQVLAVGGTIAAIGATALFFLFRMFGQRGAGKGRHIGLMLTLLAFILVCCLILIRLSYRGD